MDYRAIHRQSVTVMRDTVPEWQAYVEGLTCDDSDCAMQALDRFTAVDQETFDELRALAEQLLERAH